MQEAHTNQIDDESTDHDGERKTVERGTEDDADLFVRQVKCAPHGAGHVATDSERHGARGEGDAAGGEERARVHDVTPPCPGESTTRLSGR